MSTTMIIILGCAILATGLCIGLGGGIAIGARTTRLPSPGPVEQCETGCALAALPRNRDLILRTRPRQAGGRPRRSSTDSGPHTAASGTGPMTGPLTHTGSHRTPEEAP